MARQGEPPMTRMVIRQRAAEGAVFIEGCFDSSLGKEIPLRVDAQQTPLTCKLIKYRVVDDGGCIELAFDVPDWYQPVIEGLIASHPNEVSFGPMEDE